MKFGIAIKHERKNIRLQVELTEANEAFEKYKVSARNQSFILQNNRPVIKSRGLKHFPLTWKVVQGGYHYTSILNAIIKEIEKKI
jgi:hypothetical protein